MSGCPDLTPFVQYDANGNLTSKTDARGITTSYAYDALNRVTSRSYSDLVTPAVSYTYDLLGVANAKGRLTQVSSTASATNFTAYDALGRVTGSSQTTNGQTYTLGYGYNLAGGLTLQTYPSGRTVTTSYDSAGRVSAVSGQKTGEANKTYASLLSYAPQGAVASLTLGNTLIESTAFNNRLQPTSINLGTLATFGYGYGTTNNNGNVLSQAITSPGFTVTQNYSYDVLHRLTSVNESGLWSQTYGYDQYGNRTTVTSPTYMPTYAPAPAISAANNRISDPSFAYDGSGNLTQAPPALGAAAQTFAYDAENKLVNFNSGAATYSYDGNGRRVKKVVGSTTTVFVYNAPGQLVAEYTTPAPTTAGGTSYLTADHLGSTRVVTDSTGAIKARHDYLPFGEEIPSSIGGRTTTMGYGLNDGINQKFTAKERDNESGLDYFGARYYAGPQCRFTSVDPKSAGAELEYPQSWNGYTYAINNPLRFYDPDGKDWREAVSGVFEGAKNFVSNTVVGAVQVAVAVASDFGNPASTNTAQLIGAPLQVAVEDYSTKGFSGVLNEVLDQGQEGATAILTEAILTGGLAASARVGGTPETETVQRAMSTEELQKTQDTGLIRGGREGTHYVSDAISKDAGRAQQRLALPQKPEVRATMEVSKGKFSPPSKVQPANNMPGGGAERTATGKIPVKIKKVDEMK